MRKTGQPLIDPSRQGCLLLAFFQAVFGYAYLVWRKFGHGGLLARPVRARSETGLHNLLMFSFYQVAAIPNYRRNFIAGGCYFFTVNLLERQQTLLTDHIDLLRDSVRRVRRLYPFHIDAWVVLPDHLHSTAWMQEVG